MTLPDRLQLAIQVLGQDEMFNQLACNIEEKKLFVAVMSTDSNLRLIMITVLFARWVDKIMLILKDGNIS